MIKTPFLYGKLATGNYFTNRKDEKTRLKQNFKSGINTIIISPRRWGKSSLVNQSVAEFSQKKIIFTFIDLSNIRNEQEFFTQYSKEILKSNYTEIDKLTNHLKNFLSRFIPKISFSPDNVQDFSLSFDWEEIKRDPIDILNLPEKIAQQNKTRQVICIDEFQNISSFTDSDSFQSLLRANWQKHEHTSYCLYGSKRHMMMEVFTTSAKPFYQFGDILFLDKISKKDWISYITKSFNDTKKNINKENSSLIAEKTECHPYYTQQLAQQCWFRTSKDCTQEIIEDAHDSLTRQLSLIFQNLTDSLTTTQVNFLNALINNETEFSSKKNLQKYKLGTSANVVRIKEALLHKDVIDIMDNNITLLDPIFKNWLLEYYFK